MVYLFDEQGSSHPNSIWFTSTCSPPPDCPIEKENGGEARGVATIPGANRTCSGLHSLTATLPESFTVPPDLPEGVVLAARLDHWP